jgi:hypothetical protein
MSTTIYESPDGGKTVYARKFGTVDRTMHWQDSDLRDTLGSIKEDKLWGEIRRAAKKNSALQELLDQVKVLYLLQHENKSLY